MSETESRVRILPDFLINQIAAGEVVENAASVVKELVENAIDAGASRIAVEIENGGLGQVRVIDDGRGMSEADALTSMGRHATSKIRNLDDLMSISTMGFRGEALPSIASVSRFSMQTRRQSDDAGVRVESDSGDTTLQPCACPPGTIVEVRDLFYNVPARLKFQKSEKAQVMAVSEAFRKAALASPSIHFILKSGVRTVADFPPCSTLFDRVAMIVGGGRGLHRFNGKRDQASVNGVLGSPELFRGDTSRMILLVNGRPVTDMALRRVMIQAYSSLLPQGRFPVVIADIRVDPVAVDVNVHPQKHEVRFREAREIASMLFEAMSTVIDGTPWIAASSVDATRLPSAQPGAWPQVDSAAAMIRDSGPAGASGPSIPGLEPDIVSGPRYVGQIANTILVCEGEDGRTMLLIDQHAAHERINFNKLWHALEHGEVPSDQLLFPEVVTLDAVDMERFDDVAGHLARLGFDLERYSGESLAVRAIPAILHGRSVDAIVREAVHAATEASASGGEAILHKLVSTVACHASVRAGDRLSDIEAKALVDSMAGHALSTYCPHGRQAVVVHKVTDILKSFDR